MVLTVRFKREHPKRKLASFSMFFQPFVFSGARLRIFVGVQCSDSCFLKHLQIIQNPRPLSFGHTACVRDASRSIGIIAYPKLVALPGHYWVLGSNESKKSVSKIWRVWVNSSIMCFFVLKRGVGW